MIEDDREAVVAGHERVRGLVQQHARGRARPRRRPRRRTCRAPRPGLDLLDPRGDDDRDQPATRNQDEVTSTSLPAIVPILKVPGGRGGSTGSPVVRTRAQRYRRWPTVYRACHGLDESRHRVDRKVRGALSPSRAGDFMSLPAAVPLPHHRPAAGELLARRGARHAGPPGAGGDLRPARRRADPAAGARPARAGLGRAARAVRRRPARWPARRSTSRPGWRRPTRSLERWFTLEDPTRLEPAEREAYVEALLDSGLQLRGIVDRLDVAPDGALASSTTRPGDLRPRGSRPGPCSSCDLRPDHLAHPGRGAADAPAGLPRRRRRSSATSPTRTTSSPPSARSERSGRRSRSPRPPASSSRGAASSATGARSRRTAPSSAAPSCRCRPRHRPGPASAPGPAAAGAASSAGLRAHR